MAKAVKSTYFSCSGLMQTSIIRRLNSFGIYFLEDLSDINSYELFKIRSFGFGKCALVQHVMKKNGIKFKDDRFIKITESKYGEKFLQKHGVEI